MRQSIALPIVLFIALAAASAVLIIAASAMGDAFGRATLLAVATALLASGLTFFLLRVTSPAATQH